MAALYGVLFLAECKDCMNRRSADPQKTQCPYQSHFFQTFLTFLILVVIFIGGYGLYRHYPGDTFAIGSYILISGMLATLLGLILLFVCRNELSYVDHCCGCSNQGQGGAYGGDAGGVY